MNCICRVLELRCCCSCLLSRFIVYACFSQYCLLSCVTLYSMQLELQLHLPHQLKLYLVLHLVGHLLSPVTHLCCCCLSLDSRHASSCDIRFLAKYANSAADGNGEGCREGDGDQHYLEHFLKCTMRNNGRRGIACHLTLPLLVTWHPHGPKQGAHQQLQFSSLFVGLSLFHQPKLFALLLRSLLH